MKEDTPSVHKYMHSMIFEGLYIRKDAVDNGFTWQITRQLALNNGR